MADVDTRDELMRERIVALYREMADITLPKCKECRVPLSCCSAEYCRLAIKFAPKKWGVELKETGHKTLPLMGESGCVVAPHLRPLCTMHVCCINSIGCDPKDPEWTDKYFELRNQIENLEYELFGLGL